MEELHGKRSHVSRLSRMSRLVLRGAAWWPTGLRRASIGQDPMRVRLCCFELGHLRMARAAGTEGWGTLPAEACALGCFGGRTDG